MIDDSTPNVEVAHVPDRSEFVALGSTGQIGVLQYALDGTVLDIQHTVVQRAAGGRGVGSALVLAALDYARAEGFTVIPTCPFVPGVIEKHPAYRNLVRSTP